MRSILKSTALDNAIMSKFYPMLVLIYALAVAVAVVSKIPVLAVAVVVVVSAPFMGVFYSSYEKNNLGKLYGTLPIGRSDVVIGRYLFALLFVLANGVISGLVTLLLTQFVDGSWTQTLNMVCLSGAFLYSCFFLAVIFPIYFKVAFSRAYVLANVPFYLAIVTLIFLVKKTDLLKNIQPTIQYFTDHPEMIWISGIGIGLVLLCLSFPVSLAIYRKKEL